MPARISIAFGIATIAMLCGVAPAAAQPPRAGAPAPAAPVTYEQPLTAADPSTTGRQTLPAGNQANSLPLRRPSDAPDSSQATQRRHGSLLTVAFSLGIVLALFLAAAWLLKRGLPLQASGLPGDEFEVLGRATLAARQEVHLVRLGRKILLVAAAPAGVQTLTEVSDPEEVQRLVAACQTARAVAGERRGVLRGRRGLFGGSAPRRGEFSREFAGPDVSDTYGAKQDV